jgi:hypothetical protein
MLSTYQKKVALNGYLYLNFGAYEIAKSALRKSVRIRQVATLYYVVISCIHEIWNKTSP